MSIRRFKSVHHPGDFPRIVVYSQALLPPLAACLLPVMIGTLTAVLQGIRVLPYSLWAAAVAVGIASLWTSFGLRRRIAEIRLDGAWAQVLSVADVAARAAEPARRIVDARTYSSWVHLTVGVATYELERSDWPRFDELVEALDAAIRE